MRARRRGVTVLPNDFSPNHEPCDGGVVVREVQHAALLIFSISLFLIPQGTPTGHDTLNEGEDD